MKFKLSCGGEYFLLLLELYVKDFRDADYYWVTAAFP
jgi:hypothetical protein